MPKVDVYNMQGKKVSDVELSAAVFGIEPNEAVVHSVHRRRMQRQSRPGRLGCRAALPF